MFLLAEPCASRAAEKGYEEHQVIIGTHTSESEQNYLMLAKVPYTLNPTP